MSFSVQLMRKLEAVRDPSMKDLLLVLLEEVERHREQSVTRKEFLEFAGRTEENFREVRQAIQDLAEAQKSTEARLGELAEAQKKTEAEVAKLARGLQRNRKETGGLSRSLAYALESEAYRRLPPFLAEHHGLEVSQRIVRAEVEGEEINFFAKAVKDGREVLLVGESVLRLDDRSKLKQLHEKCRLVAEAHGGEVVPVLVTHFARREMLERARKAGVVVVQSFEW